MQQNSLLNMAYQSRTNKTEDELLKLIKSCITKKIEKESEITVYLYSVEDLINDVYLQLHDKAYNLAMVQRAIVGGLVRQYKPSFSMELYGVSPQSHHEFQNSQLIIEDVDTKPNIFDIIREEFIEYGIDGSIESIRQKRSDISLKIN